MLRHLVIIALLNAVLVSSSSAELVQHFGSLRGMMHQGKTGTTAELPRDIAGEHVIALGALSELRGEITVFGGRLWYSYPDGADATRTVTDVTTAETATLLVTATVDSWTEIPIENEMTLSQLEAFLTEFVRREEIEGAFPFTIEAMHPTLVIHVIDGSKLRKNASHEEHRSASVNLDRSKEAALLVGFYSTAHVGIFTHHDSKLHVHAVLEAPIVTGHVDELRIGEGSALRVPTELLAASDAAVKD